jgi:hypothetical protein
MKFLLVALISALLFARAVPVQSQQASDQSNIPAEEYAIYAALIGKPTVKTLVIEDQTVKHTLSADDVSNLKQQFSSISQETIDDFVRKNAKSHQLTKSFDIKLEYALISKEKIGQIFKSGPAGWDEFYRQFPDSGGYLSLSRAGLNTNGDQALVYVERSCGELCGTGSYQLLVKNDQGWAVQKRYVSWMS